MISLAMRFRGVASAGLATEVLPTYGTTIDGNDVLIEAQPYAHRMISSFLAIGSSTAKAQAGTSTSSRARPVPRPPRPPCTDRGYYYTGGQVVFDNPRDLPEPWNPKPC